MFGEAGGGFGDGGEVGDDLGGAFAGDVAPGLLRGAVVVGEDLAEQRGAGGGEDDTVGAAVGIHVAAGDEAALFEAVHEAGDVRAVGDQLAAEFGLREAVGLVGEDVEQIELAGAELPAGEEGAAGVPQRLGGAEELDEGLVAGAGWGGVLFHW